ncbi:MAG: hypothetical protein ACRYGB_03175 [Janthinobacterium lividum]
MNKKNQKFKQFGSPPGGIQSQAPGWLSCIRLCLVLNFLKYASFINIFSTLFIELFRAACKVATQVWWEDKTPGGIGFVLIFWFFLIKQKERQKRANSPFEHSFMLLKEAQ